MRPDYVTYATPDLALAVVAAPNLASDLNMKDGAAAD